MIRGEVGWVATIKRIEVVNTLLLLLPKTAAHTGMRLTLQAFPGCNLVVNVATMGYSMRRLAVCTLLTSTRHSNRSRIKICSSPAAPGSASRRMLRMCCVM